MKVVFSRKGFDSRYGGYPSIIYPDGEMLSFPIPVTNPNEYGISPREIYSRNKSLEQIFLELGIKIDQQAKLHVDPDIQYNILKQRSTNFKGAFGQNESALGHLKNNKISKGDIFLFYGTFNFTRINDNQFKYERSHPCHALWGFLYVDCKFR